MILGYGGLVSFGHAAFFGIGGYAVGILSADGIQSGWIQWPVAHRRRRSCGPPWSARCRCARAASISS